MIKRLKKRKVFLCALLALLIFFAVSSGFIWEVRIEGAENTDRAQLERAVRLAGLHEGMHKSQLKTGYEMKDIILNNTEGICWAWVYVNGTRAVVSVREEIIPPTVYNEDVPCDIIAARSGIIKKVTTTHGKCVVSENQAVAPGDTIISGTYSFPDKPGYQVHAAGEALALVSHEKSGDFKQVYSYKKYTGRRRRRLTLSLFGKQLPLYFKGSIDFEKYDTVSREYELAPFGYYLGISIFKDEAQEYETYSEPISEELARELAARRLERDISRELLPGADMVGREVLCDRIDAQTIRVTVKMDFIEKIGTEKRIEEVTFIEPKTDRADGGN